MAVRVLQVIDTLGMGGAETWLMEVLRLWSKNGAAQMDFLTTSGRTGEFDDEARELGAKIHYLHYGRRSVLQFTSQFRKVLARGRYDAIHDHQDYASGWHYLLGRGLLPPVRITHVHNPAYQIRSNYGVTAARRLSARLGKHLVASYATHITGTSRRVVTEYGFDEPRFRRVSKTALHCGFSPSRFTGNREASKAALCRELDWPLGAKIILVAGRIDQSADSDHPQTHKDSGFAVSVGIECARGDSTVHVLLAGALSPAVPVLQRQIAAAGLGERFKFAGVRKDIGSLMIASDVLLFPSRGEGLGMVAVEAQAAGLPVVASTAVPRECVVVPGLVRFVSRDRGTQEWVSALTQAMAQPRDVAGANRLVAASPFAVENSARALYELYSKGVVG